MSVAKTKREKEGKCNICLNEALLTWDHVPPKGGITMSSVEIDNLLTLLGGRQEPYKIFSPNGVKYRTICQKCNSILGSEYDPVLNALNTKTTLFLRSSLTLPSYTYLRTKPARLIRAILGHLLAAKITIDHSAFDQKVREFLFSATLTVPDDIHILYWIYPYDYTLIMRDFAIPAPRGDFSNFLFGHVLKYFPLAFLISDKAEYEGLPSLSQFKHLSLNDEIELRLDLRRLESFDWPEKVDNQNIVFASNETAKGIIAKRKK
jgi:hypothetical protein